MSRRRAAWFMAMAVLTLLVVFSAPAFPMTAEDPAEVTQESGEEVAPSSQVERILEQQDQMMRGQQFSYEPSGRRDPFLSLYENVRVKEERPRGLAGMLVNEIDLAGIVQDSSGGDVAFFTGSDNKGYFLRVGQRVYDGTLIVIDARRGAVTFRQQVDDPRQIKPYRDVVRRLVPLDEESTNE